MKAGIVINNIGVSQLSYNMIKKLNARVRANPMESWTLFFENPYPYISSPLCPLMQAFETNGFHAPVIATSLVSARKLINTIGPTRKLFYVWNLEWLTPHILPYDYYAPVYTSPKLELIARNQEHVSIIQNCFNRDVLCTVDDFDFEKITEVLK